MLFPQFIGKAASGGVPPTITNISVDDNVAPVTCNDSWLVAVTWTLADYNDTIYRLDVEVADNGSASNWTPLWDDVGILPGETLDTGVVGDTGEAGHTAYRAFRLTISRRSDNSVVAQDESEQVVLNYGECPEPEP